MTASTTAAPAAPAATPMSTVQEAPTQEGKTAMKDKTPSSLIAMQYTLAHGTVTATEKRYTRTAALARLKDLMQRDSITKANAASLACAYMDKGGFKDAADNEPSNATQLAATLSCTRTELYQLHDIGAHDHLHAALAHQQVAWTVLCDIAARTRRKDLTLEQSETLTHQAAGATMKEYRALLASLTGEPTEAPAETAETATAETATATATATAARDAVLANLLQLAPEDREHVLSEAMHTLPLPAMRRLAAIAKTAAAKANAPTAPALGEDAPTAPAGEDLVS
jgi:hypothetical protein